MGKSGLIVAALLSAGENVGQQSDCKRDTIAAMQL